MNTPYGNNTKPPTLAQRELLMLIADYTDARGWPPTFREMCTALHLSSMNALSERLQGAEDRGLIITHFRTARGVRLTPRGLAAIGRTNRYVFLRPTRDALGVVRFQ